MTELEVIFESIKIGAIIIGGLVALYEYQRFRRFGYKAQLNLDFDVYPVKWKKEEYLLDIKPEIENKGSVRQKFPIIEVWVKSTTDNDINKPQTANKFIRFSKELFPEENIVYDPTDPYFIDPGVTQLFPIQIKVQNPGDFVRVSVRFFYQVSFLTNLRLRLLCSLNMSKKWNDTDRIKRLKKYQVDNYHIISKTKQIKDKIKTD